MKKLIYTLIIFTILLGKTYSAEKKDCKNLKKFSDRIACKAENLKTGTTSTAGKIFKSPKKLFEKNPLKGIFTGAPKD
tara:strand:- start:290 stop:523 length:234 start_codon:yes stop_codon:yes gene_type:complete